MNIDELLAKSVLPRALPEEMRMFEQVVTEMNAAKSLAETLALRSEMSVARSFAAKVAAEMDVTKSFAAKVAAEMDATKLVAAQIAAEMNATKSLAEKFLAAEIKATNRLSEQLFLQADMTAAKSLAEQLSSKAASLQTTVAEKFVRNLADMDAVKLLAPTMSLNSEMNRAMPLRSRVFADVASLFVHQQRLQELQIPPNFQAAMDAIAAYKPPPSLQINAEAAGLLQRLQPYAAVTPALPDADTLEAIRSQVGDILNVAGDKDGASVSALLQFLLLNARRIGYRGVSFLLFTVIYPLLLCVYQDDLKQIVHPRRPRNEQRQLARAVAASVFERVPAAALQTLRYVSVDVLNVRSSARRNSGCAGNLHFGDVVMEVRTTKDWTLVEFNDGDVELRGWVITRYLKRFR
jgi:hypothetical protein